MIYEVGASLTDVLTQGLLQQREGIATERWTTPVNVLKSHQTPSGNHVMRTAWTNDCQFFKSNLQELPELAQWQLQGAVVVDPELGSFELGPKIEKNQKFVISKRILVWDEYAEISINTWTKYTSFKADINST